MDERTRGYAQEVSRRSIPGMVTVALAAVLAACSDTAVTDVDLTPTSPSLSVSGGAFTRELAKVCKDDSNVPAGETFQYSVSTSANPVSVTAGQCVTVLVTGTPTNVTVSELPKTGFTKDSVKRDVGSGLQPTADPVTCSVSGSTGCVIVYYNHQNAPPPPVITYSGEATVVRAKVLLGVDLTLVKAGPLASSGGSDQESLLTANVPGLLTASLLNASTQAGGSSSQSNASIAKLALGVHGLTVSADLVESTAQAVCSNGSESVSGSSKIVKLVIAGKAIVVTGAPNQTVWVALGKVVINEQLKSSDAITVNAIHVYLGSLANVVISQAHADIHC